MSGLTSKQARERLRQDGENELSASAKLHPVRMFLGQFRDVMVLILLAATAVSAFLGEVTDAVTIILIVLLNAILGFLQEFRTEQIIGNPPATSPPPQRPSAGTAHGRPFRHGNWCVGTASGWRQATTCRQMLRWLRLPVWR